jgi:hypothetical protein
MYCFHCGKEVEVQAVMCIACGYPIQNNVSTVKTKDKTVSILLAVFLSFWTWCYTYKKDAWKFWLNLVLSVITIGYWIPVAWIWAIIDVSMKPQDFYRQFPFWCGLPNENPKENVPAIKPLTKKDNRVFGDKTNLEECYKIISNMERKGMDLSTYKTLLRTAQTKGDQDVIDAVLGRLKKTVFLK